LSTIPASATARLNLLAVLSLISLIALCLAWELWLAPLRAGGSWLVLKTLPLLTPLFGIIRGKRYTHQWASLLILPYLAEASTRAMSDHGVSATLAIIELALATIFFAATVAYARLTRPTAQRKRAAELPRVGG
jgi:uncharacterized membrane protein